jgi:hypothetical protein
MLRFKCQARFLLVSIYLWGLKLILNHFPIIYLLVLQLHTAIILSHKKVKKEIVIKEQLKIKNS